MTSTHIHHYLIESQPRDDGLFHGTCKFCPATMTAPSKTNIDLHWKFNKNKKRLPDSEIEALARAKDAYRLEYQVALNALYYLTHERKEASTTRLRFGKR